MNRDIEVLEFRKINTEDVYDENYNDGDAWSRVYEYPLIINKIKEHCDLNSATKIHNSSWGFQKLHIQFKNALDELSSECTHTDVLKSDLPKTGIWNITKKPPIKFLEAFDIVINVSTMEEVYYDHMKVFDNLLSQVKVGGILICTFDLPGLQLEKFEKRFGRKLKSNINDITGENSQLQNLTYSNLSCGYLVVKKTESTIESDNNFFKRIFNL